MLRAAKSMVADDRPLVLFAEGTRVPHGETPPMRSGFAGIYKLVGLPVLPIAVDSGPLYHRWIKRKGVITYQIGEMIPAGLPRDEVEAKVHAAINVLNG
jgi:1-acyl-sn-glycerol-3-phosphate acyltransferase